MKCIDYKLTSSNEAKTKKRVVKTTASTQNWYNIHWQEAQNNVINLQKQIVVAYKNKDHGKVTELQWTMVNSFDACCVAVKKVTSNPGKNTAGVDQKIQDRPQRRMQGVRELYNLEWNGYTAKPVRQVWIQKPNTGKKRPLGIPTIFDRTVQTVWNLAQVPIAECTGERNSYGFRPNRSCKDAMQALYLRLGQRYGPHWVLEADIQGFFDNLNHEWMLQHIPLDSHVLNEWLKAGILDKGI